LVTKINPERFYCEDCDQVLTSLAEKLQHQDGHKDHSIKEIIPGGDRV